MMEDYIAHCEKAKQTGKRYDLPKYLQTKLADQELERENNAVAKAIGPPKAADSSAYADRHES